MRPQQPPSAGASSWVQMSASGATQLARRSQAPPLRLSGCSSSSVSSASSVSGQSAGGQSGGRAAPLLFAASASAAAASSSSSSSLASNSNSNSNSLSGAHATSSSSSSFCARDSVSSLQLNKSAASQQLQAAMSQLQLVESQQLLQTASGDSNDQQRAQQLEDTRKLRLQLYVFVLRCISYPFNARQQQAADQQHRGHAAKLRPHQLQRIVAAHTRYIGAAGAFAPARCPHQHLIKQAQMLHQCQLTQAHLRQLDQLYQRAHLTFNRRVLQSERLAQAVESAASLSHQDLRDLFRRTGERLMSHSKMFQVSSSSRSAAAVGGSSQAAAQLVSQRQQEEIFFAANKDSILSSWLIKFESIIRDDQNSDQNSPNDSQPHHQPHHHHHQHQHQLNQQSPFSKEQLYQMYQSILNIKKFEHQLLYNALQLDSQDEQAAAIRRELDGRVARIAELERNRKLLPKFVLKEMESLYLEELRMAVNKLMVNLDTLPLSKPSGSGELRGVHAGLQKFRRYNNRAQASMTRDGLADGHPAEPQLSKLDVMLTFNIEVIVMEIRGLNKNIAAQREIYCTMEIENSETGRLQTEHVPAKKPLWDTQGDFVTNHPLPVLKIKLYAVNQSVLSLEDKELAKLVLRPTVLSPKSSEWCVMQPSGDKSIIDTSSSGSVGGGSAGGQLEPGDNQLRLRVIVRMDRPQQLKHCGYLWAIGKSSWRKLKRRYHVLIQVSQYTFVMCEYRDKKSKPSEMLQLDGYTVDYIEPPTDLIMEHCSDVSSRLHHHHHSSDHHHHSSAAVSSTLGLAGRLAKPFLSASGANKHHHHHHHHQSTTNEPDESSEQQAQQPSAIQTAAALSDELHNKHYFNVVREGDSVVFACDDQQECAGWVMALYRATGQAHKPTPLRQGQSSTSSASYALSPASSADQHELSGIASSDTALGSSVKVGVSGAGLSSMLLNHHQQRQQQQHPQHHHQQQQHQQQHHHQHRHHHASSSGSSASAVDVADQRARKHGMDEFISADPCKFNHNHLYRYLQNETLLYRLQDEFCSLGWLSAGQVLVLDEYCARYNVRTCFRHLSYLDSLLDINEKQSYFIDHTLLNLCYDFCSSFVSGGNNLQVMSTTTTTAANSNMGAGQQPITYPPICSINFDLRPDGMVGSVTCEERDLFLVVKQKLLKMIERQISMYSQYFPFGKPDGSLKATLSLLERVLMKEQSGGTNGAGSLMAAAAAGSLAHNDDIRTLIRKCLEQAALNNYTRLSGKANLLAASSSADEQQQETVLADSSAPASHTGSPVPLAASKDSESQQAGGGGSSLGSTSVAGFNLDLFGSGRRRTQSNLSSCSQASSQPSTSSQLSGQSIGGSSQQSAAQANQKPPEPRPLTMAAVIGNEQMWPMEKLRYLVRLAELCCEQVEENHEYFWDSFAWHSDLMQEHFELFWSLFSVDMDKILAEIQAAGLINGHNPQQQTTSSASSDTETQARLQQQAAPRNQMSQLAYMRSTFGSIASAATSGMEAANLAGDSAGGIQSANINSIRELFVLFQVLNDHMRRNNSQYECKKFRSYLCDIFKPKLLRYIDQMESILTRMVFKACEKDNQVNCQLIEQMFTKLDELQRFVLIQLRWPDEQLAEQLLQRLKLISYELCDASVQRTLQTFQQLEKKLSRWTANTTSYTSPVEMMLMINLVLETRNRSLKLCTFNGFDQMSYHSKIDKLIEMALNTMQPGLIAKMLNALESTLNKLARYDEGKLLAPILSLTYKQGMSSSGKDIGKQYVEFVSNCCDSLRHKINDELWIITLLEDWYSVQMKTICGWLSARIDRSLHDVQLVALTNVMQKIYADMSLQGVAEDKLNLKSYQTVMSRLKMEEAAALASGGCLFEQPSNSIFNTSILSSITSTSSGSSGSPSFVSTSVATGTSAGGPSASQATCQPFESAGGAPTPECIRSQQQQQLFGPNRRFGSLSSPATTQMALGGGSAELEQSEDNIADRALQSATRMFKGFWTTN